MRFDFLKNMPNTQQDLNNLIRLHEQTFRSFNEKKLEAVRLKSEIDALQKNLLDIKNKKNQLEISLKQLETKINKARFDLEQLEKSQLTNAQELQNLQNEEIRKRNELQNKEQRKKGLDTELERLNIQVNNYLKQIEDLKRETNRIKI